jgi:hypothetical protein
VHAAHSAAGGVRVRERILSRHRRGGGGGRAPAVLLVVGLGVVGAGPPPSPQSTAAASADAGARCAIRPPLYRIELTATERAPGAKGVARLRPRGTPFGLPVTVDGHLELDVEVSAEGLPAPATFGAYATYAGWVATPNLDNVVRLGPLIDGVAHGRVAWNKFLVFISAEPRAIGEHWTGPVVLRGMSASGYMQNFSAHPLFNGGVPPC